MTSPRLSTNTTKSAPPLPLKRDLGGRRSPFGGGAAAAAALLALLAPLGAHAQADLGILDQRRLLLEHEAEKQQTQQVVAQEETEPWGPSKIMVNLNARCPVVSALGFFAAFSTGDKNPAKAQEEQTRYTQLQQALQPMAAELLQIATSTQFVGLTFPTELDQHLRYLRGQLDEIITKIYGADALAELEQYVTIEAQGGVVGLNPTGGS